MDVNNEIESQISSSPEGGSGTVKQKPRYWTEDEDGLLRKAIERHGCEGYETWKEVAMHVPGRSYRECMQRWTKVLSPDLKKGKWSPDEDILLRQLVEEQLNSAGKTGKKKIVWNTVAKGFTARSCKQCRERWVNHLDPSVVKTEWTRDEDIALIRLYQEFPNKWAKIARGIEGRTENMVKVRWNALSRQMKKRKHYFNVPSNSNYDDNNEYLRNINGFLNKQRRTSQTSQLNFMTANSNNVINDMHGLQMNQHFLPNIHDMSMHENLNLLQAPHHQGNQNMSSGANNANGSVIKQTSLQDLENLRNSVYFSQMSVPSGLNIDMNYDPRRNSLFLPGFTEQHFQLNTLNNLPMGNSQGLSFTPNTINFQNFNSISFPNINVINAVQNSEQEEHKYQPAKLAALPERMKKAPSFNSFVPDHNSLNHGVNRRLSTVVFSDLLKGNTNQGIGSANIHGMHHHVDDDNERQMTENRRHSLLLLSLNNGGHLPDLKVNPAAAVKQE